MEAAAAHATAAVTFARKRPACRPFPEYLSREQVVLPRRARVPACGGRTRLSKRGEDVTETLEVIPRRWKVSQHARERFSCRDFEAITQPPVPFHVVLRGWAGAGFLTMLLFEKYGAHQRLHR